MGIGPNPNPFNILKDTNIKFNLINYIYIYIYIYNIFKNKEYFFLLNLFDFIIKI